MNDENSTQNVQKSIHSSQNLVPSAPKVNENLAQTPEPQNISKTTDDMQKISYSKSNFLVKTPASNNNSDDKIETVFVAVIDEEEDEVSFNIKPETPIVTKKRKRLESDHNDLVSF